MTYLVELAVAAWFPSSGNHNTCEQTVAVTSDNRLSILTRSRRRLQRRKLNLASGMVPNLIATMPLKRPKPLSRQDIHRAVLKRLEHYDDLSFVEEFAMFMGKAQLLEIALKQLLARRRDYNLSDMERWTLGRAAKELKRCGMREDFTTLLDDVVAYRNFIAHELLASGAFVTALTGKTARFVRRPLEHGIYALEQLMFLHDWCEKHDAWT